MDLGGDSHTCIRCEAQFPSGATRPIPAIHRTEAVALKLTAAILHKYEDGDFTNNAHTFCMGNATSYANADSLPTEDGPGEEGFRCNDDVHFETR